MTEVIVSSIPSNLNHDVMVYVHHYKKNLEDQDFILFRIDVYVTRDNIFLGRFNQEGIWENSKDFPLINEEELIKFKRTKSILKNTADDLWNYQVPKQVNKVLDLPSTEVMDLLFPLHEEDK